MANVTIDPKKVRPLLSANVRAHDMGEASQLGRWVYVASDGKVYETDAASAAKVSGNLGMIISGGRSHPDGLVAAGERVGVCWFGEVALNNGTLDVTKIYYAADETASVTGLMSDADDGTVTRRLGSPVTADIFFINPDTAGPTSA